MSGHQLELVRSKDGGAYLSYWDWQSGQDTVWKIDRDGNASRVEGNDIVLIRDLGKDILLELKRIEDRK